MSANDRQCVFFEQLHGRAVIGHNLIELFQNMLDCLVHFQFFDDGQAGFS